MKDIYHYSSKHIFPRLLHMSSNKLDADASLRLGEPVFSEFLVPLMPRQDDKPTLSDNYITDHILTLDSLDKYSLDEPKVYSYQKHQVATIFYWKFFSHLLFFKYLGSYPARLRWPLRPATATAGLLVVVAIEDYETNRKLEISNQLIRDG